MKKVILTTILISSIILLSGCGEKERIEELEVDIADYETQVQNLKSVIEECEININEARQYAGTDYDDMEYALENLDDCQY